MEEIEEMFDESKFARDFFEYTKENVFFGNNRSEDRIKAVYIDGYIAQLLRTNTNEQNAFIAESYYIDDDYYEYDDEDDEYSYISPASYKTLAKEVYYNIWEKVLKIFYECEIDDLSDAETDDDDF